ncbi:MAG TPA: AAA family ATPase [Dongiaceae bacterium]|jgi:cell division protease FtsH|nr:AAA family ATPase [Dongiaceae bacterium]
MQRVWRRIVRKYHLLSRRDRLAFLLVILLGAGAAGWISWTQLASVAPDRISMTKLVQDAHDGLIKSAALSDRSIGLTYSDGKEAAFRGRLPDETVMQLVAAGVDVSFSDSTLLDFLGKYGYPLLMLVPMLLIAWHVLGGANRFAIGGPTKLLDRSAAKYRFSDVAGQEEAKEQMTEIVEFLRDPETFTRLGAKAPKGALMVGPPGVGKTLLARAVAGETNAAFIAVSGADFRQTFMGLGANKVRNMFKLARDNAPALIFIDEIETLARKRSSKASGSINTEEEATLNALLVEMDGFNTSKGIVVLAATNRPDLIDEAVLRPGRFDRRINLDIPDLTGRLGILHVHARSKALADTVDLSVVARRTTGMSGADLENLLNEAAIRATRRSAPAIVAEDIEGAYFDVLLGRVRKGTALSDSDRRAIAIHEAGHAIAAATVDGAKRPEKATIVPRGRALGVVLSSPKEDQRLVSRQQLLSDIVVCLSGRAAELMEFGEQGISTGAEDDLRQATNLASRMAALWSMGSSTPVLSITEESSMNARRQAEERAQTIIDQAWAEALETLTRHKLAHGDLVAALLERETVDGTEIEAMVQAHKDAQAPAGLAAE